MTIKRKLIGSFVISFLILIILFMGITLPNFREDMLNNFKNDIFNNMITIDEKAHYMLKAEMDSMTLDDMEKMSKDDLMFIMDNHKIFSPADIWELDLGGLNIVMDGVHLSIDEDGKSRMTEIPFNLNYDDLVSISKNDGFKIIDHGGERYYLFVMQSKVSNNIYFRKINSKRLLDRDYDRIESIVNVGAAFLLAFSGFILFFTHKIIIIPIRKLNNVTKSIVETGNMNITVDIDSYDEIGQTANSFNQMIKKVHDTQNSLEDMVKERTEKLEMAKQEAEKASKAKSEFLANMSHEIRTPINAVIGLNDLLSRTQLNFKQADYIEKISKAAKNLLNIINDILDFSKVEAGKMTIESIKFKIEDIIDDISGIVGIKASNQGIEFVIKVDNNVPQLVKGDPKRITQILLNLINNAVKFTHEGEVLLDISLKEEYEDSVDLEFKIKDTGIGMKPETLETLFEEFTQADTTTTRNYGGTGLGLAITKKLLDLMNSEIIVESQYGIGTTFSFTLRMPKASDETRKVLLDAYSFNDFKVLIVDDNKDQLLTFNEYLSPAVKKLYTVTNGQDALDAMAINAYDLLIIDYKMQPINGFETIDLILSRDDVIKPKKIIMTTAYGREIMDSEYSKYPIDDVLMKPVQQKSLLKSIDRAFKVTSPKKESNEEISNEQRRLGRILVAEDNEINQLVVIENLEFQGYSVDVAKDGLEAVAMASNNHYDMILMDLQMPNLSGYEASEKILKASKQPIPIIALTADVFTGVEEEVKKYGMVGYISKPIDFDALFKLMDQFKPVKNTKVLKNEEEITKEQLQHLLPSFNVNEGLSRLNNNIKSYIRILSRFRDTSTTTINFLQKAIEEKDISIIKKRLHQFKGASGNLGFMKGHEKAKKIESNIKATNEFIVEEFRELFSIIKKAQEEIDALKKVRSLDRKNLISKSLKNALEQLLNLVSNYDVEAFDLLENYQEVFKNQNYSDFYKKLAERISAYEYEEAVTIIESLLNKLKED